jgi:hypothetical protein
MCNKYESDTIHEITNAHSTGVNLKKFIEAKKIDCPNSKITKLIPNKKLKVINFSILVNIILILLPISTRIFL